MPKFAVIKNGKINNIVVAEPDYAAEKGWISLTNDAGIDWDYINGQFVDNRPLPEMVAVSAPSKEDLIAQLNVLAAQIQALS